MVESEYENCYTIVWFKVIMTKSMNDEVTNMCYKLLHNCMFESEYENCYTIMTKSMNDEVTNVLQIVTQLYG